LIRRASRADIPRIMEIRGAVRENRLRDPSRVKVEDVWWYVDNPGIFVWIEDRRIVGFSAADPRNGNIFALFVGEAYEGRGIGRALFERACEVLIDARSCRGILSQGGMAGYRHRRRQLGIRTVRHIIEFGSGCDVSAALRLR
jgi:GNAT superfamily N-acetyltransferase